MTLSQTTEVRIWLSTLCVMGILPFGLLLATTGPSIWAFSSLLWLLFTLSYVAFPVLRVSRFLSLSIMKRMLWHAGIRIGYAAFAMTLWFILGLPVLGIIALVLPLLPDLINEWYISPRTRKHAVVSAVSAVTYVFVILILLWLEYRF